MLSLGEIKELSNIYKDDNALFWELENGISGLEFKVFKRRRK